MADAVAMVVTTDQLYLVELSAGTGLDKRVEKSQSYL